MATIIIRNSTGSGAVPSSLVQGELAINTVDGKLFYGSGSGNIVKEFTASNSLTASYLNTLNQDLTFNGNLTLNGTASISTLVVNQTQYSSGSNQLGDAANDTQTLYGSVIIPTGSLTVTGSTTSTGGFTGSLFGTASWAISASQAISASRATSASYALSASYAPSSPAFPYVGAAVITGSLIVSGSGGGNASLDTVTSELKDPTGTVSIDWSNRVLNDSSATPSVDWNNRALYDTNTSGSVSWYERALLDSGGNNSIDWSNRYLLDTSGTTKVDWETGILADLAGNPSLDWESRVLNEASATFKALDYSNDTYVDSQLYYRNIIPGQVQRSMANTPTYAGQLIQATIDGGVSDYQLVFLDTDGTWKGTKNTVASGATQMLGIAVDTAGGYVLIEGDVGVSDDNSQGGYVIGADHGLPIYISGTSGVMTTTAPSGGGELVRIVGYVYYQSSSDANWWIMKFRPSNDWYEI